MTDAVCCKVLHRGAQRTHRKTAFNTSLPPSRLAPRPLQHAPGHVIMELSRSLGNLETRKFHL